MKIKTENKCLAVKSLTVFLLLFTLKSPVFSFTPSTAPAETQSVPGNMLLALSVEFPTGLQESYNSSTYDTSVARFYEGYFDNRKCYSYNSTNEVFIPQSGRNSVGGCPDTSHWSGNLLNWLTMTNLDQFRSVMTGGTRDNFSSKNATHPGDNEDRTVLIRSYSDRNSYVTVKTLSTALRTAGLPSAYGDSSFDNVRNGDFGSKFFINASNSFSDLDATQQQETCAATVARGLTGMATCFNIRVEVCQEVAATGTSAAVGREPNCVGPYRKEILPSTTPKTYKEYFKPEGLVQSYSGSIRFGAMGYLNETGQSRNGGVLRAAMKSVGSKNIGQGDTANTNREWDDLGFLVVNPNPTDATNSSVSQSGVINYLNKFGYAAGYKGNDPVGELFYASQLYFRNQSFPTSYTDNLTDARKDGFPVITSFSDPIVKTCQRNFILGIGDIYTHCDGNLPGSTSTYLDSTCGATTPTDSSINVNTLWSSITSMQGSSSWTGGSTKGSPFMSGLAWWANVNDIRSDLNGKQTIATYWVDVLENNNGGAGIGAKSQFWLAAKYGGFKQELLTSGSDPNSNVLSWDKNGDGRPDTLFAGNDPLTLKASLRAAFEDILSRSADSSASSAAVTSNRQTSSSQVIYAGYSPKDWTGGVRSCLPNQTATQCEASPVWEASRWFDTTYTAGASPKLNETNRKIFTSNLTGTTFTESPFLWASLLASQQSVLNATDSRGSDRVSYLRGSRALEGTTFRTRGSALMGDVVNSNVTYLAGSGPSYRGANFSGHSTYRAANAARPAVIYVGANDGMLHAFDASNGKELWGYVPGSVFANLPALTSPSFVHQYFVDGTPMVADTETGATPPWRTMLVGGLGGGGKGYYGLDISRQIANASNQSFSTMTEAELAAIPMWEFTSAQDSDLGYTFNEPSVDPISNAFKQIAKVADPSVASGVWRVIVGNGYGSGANKAALFFLNSETGAAALKLVASTSLSDNGLSSPAPVDTDNDGLIDTVYAGDLQGKLHKFQFSKLDANGVDYKLAAKGDSTGVWRYIGVLFDAATPITAAPVVTKACSGTAGWQVLFGTGKLNENSDFSSTSTNAFYSITDNNISSALTVASSLLADISYTQSTVSIGNVRNWTAPSLAAKKGWKISFSNGERIISNPTIPPDTGAVLFGTAKPSGDLCEPGSSGYLMSVNICTAGIGNLTIFDGTADVVVGGFGVAASGVLKVSNTYTNTDNKQTIVCNQPDCQRATPPTLQSIVAPRGRYSWRELFSR